MTKPASLERTKGVRLFSLLLAVLLWLSVVLERPGEMKLQVPVLPEYLPAGLRLVSPAPAPLEITVSGPRILLLRLPFRPVNCRLDLSSAAVGTAGFTPLESSFALDGELKVVRVSPAVVRLTVEKIVRR